MGRWLEQWSLLRNEHEATLWQWLSPLTSSTFEGKAVLDAGCGNGGNASIISKYAKHVTGVDLESTASPLIKQANNISYQTGNLEKLDISNEYDIGFSVGVLHHLQDPDAGFRNLVQAVKPGGIVAIWVYSKEGNWFMRVIVEPIKSHFLFKLPQPLFKFIAHVATLIGYSLAYFPLYFIKTFSWLPYFNYFEYWRSYSYDRNFMNVYDKLNAPTTHWIPKSKIVQWSGALKNPVYSDFNRVSWRLSGIKP